MFIHDLDLTFINIQKKILSNLLIFLVFNDLSNKNN